MTETLKEKPSYPDNTPPAPPPAPESSEQRKIREMEEASLSFSKLDPGIVNKEPKKIGIPTGSARIVAELTVGASETATDSQSKLIAESPEEIGELLKHASDQSYLVSFMNFMEKGTQSSVFSGLQLAKGVPGVTNQRYRKEWVAERKRIIAGVKRHGLTKSMKEAAIQLYTGSHDADFLEIASSMLDHGIRNKLVENSEDLPAFILANALPKTMRVGGKEFATAYGEYVNFGDGLDEQEYRDIKKILQRAWDEHEAPAALEARVIAYMAKEAFSASFIRPENAEYIANNFPVGPSSGKVTATEIDTFRPGKPVVTSVPVDVGEHFQSPPFWPLQVYRNFVGEVTRKYGKGAGAKLAYYGARETANMLLAIRALKLVGVATSPGVLIKSGQTSLDIATNALNWAAGSMGFFAVTGAQDAAYKHYVEGDGEWIDTFAQNLVLGALGGGILPPLAIPFRPGAMILRDGFRQVATKKVNQVSKTFGRKHLYKNTVEQMSENASTVEASRSLAVAADDVALGKKGVPLEETAAVTSPVEGRLGGAIKVGAEADQVSSELQRKLGASPEIGTARTAMDRNIAKEAETVTVAVGAEKKNGSQSIHFRNTDIEVVYNPNQLIKNYTAKELENLTSMEFMPGPGLLGGIKSAFGNVISQDERNWLTKKMVEIYTSVQHKSRADLAMDLKEVRAIYKEAGFFVPGIRARKDIASYRLGQLNKFDKAVAASRDAEEWFHLEDLIDTFKLNNHQVNAYYKLKNFSKRIYEREHENILNTAKAQGWKVHPNETASDGTQYLMRRPWKEQLANVKNIAEMSDDEIAKLPFMQKLIADYKAAPENQLFIDEVSMGMEETGRILREHPVELARSGREPLIPWDMNTGTAGRVRGKTVIMDTHENMVEPSKLLTEVPGYSPIVYADSMTWKGAKINHAVLDQIEAGKIPSQPAFEVVYGTRNPASAKRYGETLEIGEHESYVVIGQDANSASIDVTSITNQLNRGNTLTETKLEILKDYIKQQIPEITEKQLANFNSAYVPRFIAPMLQARGKRLAGPGLGREVWHRSDETGKMVSKWDSEAAKVVPSLRAFEIRLSQLSGESSTGLVRNQLIDEYEKTFGYMIGQENAPVLHRKLLTPAQLNDDTPAAYTNYRNAKGIRDTLRQFAATPGPLERWYNKGMENLAFAAGGGKNGVTRSDHLWSWVFSGASNLRSMMTAVKTVTAYQVFAGSVSAHLNQYAGAHAALWTRIGIPGVKQAEMLSETALVLLAKIPKVGKLAPPAIKRQAEELRKMGTLGQLTDNLDFANPRQTILTDVLMGSVLTGEATVRVLSFISARKQMRSMWKTDMGESRGWFLGKDLTTDGYAEAHKRAQNMYANLTRVNAPRALSEFPGSMIGQFVLNPALKELERMTLSKKFTKAEKLRMWGASLAIYGGWTVPGFIDAQLAVYKLGHRVQNYFEGGELEPKTGMQLKKEVHTFVGEYLHDLTGTKDAQFWKRFADGALLNAFLGEGESELQFMNRFGFGMIVHDTIDRAERGAWQLIPAVSVATGTGGGILDAIKFTRLLHEQKGGYTESYDGEMGEALSMEKRKDIALKLAVNGIPGARNGLALAYVFGMNFEQEAKYLTRFADRSVKEMEDMTFGDYITIITGWGPNLMRELGDLRDVKYNRVQWMKAQALETYKMFLAHPGKALLRDERVWEAAERGGIEPKHIKKIYDGTLQRLQNRQGDSVQLELYYEKLDMDLEINEEVDVPSFMR